MMMMITSYDNESDINCDGAVVVLSIGDHGFDQRLNFGMNGEFDCNMLMEESSSFICDLPTIIVNQRKAVVDGPKQ